MSPHLCHFRVRPWKDAKVLNSASQLWADILFSLLTRTPQVQQGISPGEQNRSLLKSVEELEQQKKKMARTLRPLELPHEKGAQRVTVTDIPVACSRLNCRLASTLQEECAIADLDEETKRLQQAYSKVRYSRHSTHRSRPRTPPLPTPSFTAPSAVPTTGMPQGEEAGRRCHKGEAQGLQLKGTALVLLTLRTGANPRPARLPVAPPCSAQPKRCSCRQHLIRRCRHRGIETGRMMTTRTPTTCRAGGGSPVRSQPARMEQARLVGVRLCAAMHCLRRLQSCRSTPRPGCLLSQAVCAFR